MIKVDQMLKEILTAVKSIDERLSKVEKSVTIIEHDHGSKISALFDGYTLRGDQVKGLKEHLDERLDSIQTDLSYVVSKIAQHDRNIVRLNKKAE